MKTFEEAALIVMGSGPVNFSKKWTFTTDILTSDRLEMCLEAGLKEVPECHPECTYKFLMGALKAAFELGMCVGIEMEKAE